jgi:hypothetical protein
MLDMGFQMITKPLSNYGAQMKHGSVRIKRMSFESTMARNSTRSMQHISFLKVK